MLCAFSITVPLITWLPLYFKNLVLKSLKMSNAYALGLLYNSFAVEPPSFINWAHGTSRHLPWDRVVFSVTRTRTTHMHIYKHII